MSADKVPDTHGIRRDHGKELSPEFEENMRKLVQGNYPQHPDVEEYQPEETSNQQHRIPTAEAGPVVVRTREFCDRMKGAADHLARKMDDRAFRLEKKAEELRSRASKLKHYSSSLATDMNSFAEVMSEYYADVESLSLVEPKDDENNENGKESER